MNGTDSIDAPFNHSLLLRRKIRSSPRGNGYVGYVSRKMISTGVLLSTLFALPSIAIAQSFGFENGMAGSQTSGDYLIMTAETCGGLLSMRPRPGGSCGALWMIAPYQEGGEAMVTFGVTTNKIAFWYSGAIGATAFYVEAYDASGNFIGGKGELPGSVSLGYVFENWGFVEILLPATARSVLFRAKNGAVVLDDVEFSLVGDDVNVPAYSTPPRNCPAQLKKGNPIEPLLGRKSQQIDLGFTLGGVPVSLSYDSFRASRGATSTSLPSFGGGWTASWLRNVSSTTFPFPTPQIYTSSRPDGREETFSTRLGDIVTADSGDDDFLKVSPEGRILYYAINDASLERKPFFNGAFDQGAVSSIFGAALNIVVSDRNHPLVLGGAQVSGLPVELSDQFGRKVALQYQVIPAGGDPYRDAKVVSMTVPGGGALQFGYSISGNLTSIAWPDGTTTELAYSDPDSTNRLWTGIVDEAGKRYSTFTYDENGLVVSSEHAGGVGRYSSAYSAPPAFVAERIFDHDRQKWIVRHRLSVPEGTALTGPNGVATQVGAAQVANTNGPVSFSQPGGSGCGPSTSTQEFDAKGNLAWREDFNGHRSCHAHDLSRNLETGRVEGLAAGSSCGALLADNATLPVDARKVTTSWHPVWRLETRVAEPRRLTSKVYNGQPDPFAGGATAWCAPSNATLPDGSPIVVLCKQVEQATTDVNGSQGLAAAIDTSVPTRTQQWTYTQYGQVLTAKDALNNTTSYAYYPSTTADHAMGDLATVTNAKQQVITYSKYNPAGQWLEMVDVNNVTTTRTFDLRQRLKSVATAGATTSYDYWPTGLLKKVTLPDASAVSYGYDDAHRLTSVTDNLGNKVTYALDNSGNRIGEEIKDPTGRLAKTLTRVPDALNRIQQVTGRE